MGWTDHIARLVDIESVCVILVGKSEAKRPLRIPKHYVTG
jgi:uncharacterized membrane protein YdfJ with MMPL/SSD domain